ncbi:MAG: AraC family transcriptional regulator [Nonlabens sp.]
MENIVKGTDQVTVVDTGFKILRLRNEDLDHRNYHYDVDCTYLQFNFCLKGAAQLLFNNGSYRLELKEQQSYMLYNPAQDLPLNIVMQPQTWVVAVIISITKFHSLFSEDAAHVSFLSSENQHKKYYVDGTVNPSMAVVLHQLMNYNLNDTIKQLYFKGKAYELLSLYFYREEDARIDACPFLADEENMRKIKEAKEIVLQNLTNPPGLHDLAEQIGLSLKKLKEGFKEVYGDTVHGFALSHKMDYARQLLESGKYNVNEVGLKVGYSTGSHFINAFKKKYGTTPRRYSK